MAKSLSYQTSDHLVTRSAAFAAHHRRPAETPSRAMGFLVQSPGQKNPSRA
jgi:hypothetical protein